MAGWGIRTTFRAPKKKRGTSRAKPNSVARSVLGASRGVSTGATRTTRNVGRGPSRPTGRSYGLNTVQGTNSPRLAPRRSSGLNSVRGVSPSRKRLAKLKKQEAKRRKQAKVRETQRTVKALIHGKTPGLKPGILATKGFTTDVADTFDSVGQKPPSKKQRKVYMRTSKAVETLMRKDTSLSKKLQARQTIKKYGLPTELRELRFARALQLGVPEHNLTKQGKLKPYSVKSPFPGSTKKFRSKEDLEAALKKDKGLLGVDLSDELSDHVLKPAGKLMSDYWKSAQSAQEAKMMVAPDIQKQVHRAAGRGILAAGGGLMEGFERTSGFGMTAFMEAAAALGNKRAQRIVKRAPGAFDVIGHGRGKKGITGGQVAKTLGLPKQAGVAFEIAMDPTMYIALAAAPVTGGASLTMVLSQARNLAKAGKLDAELVNKYVKLAAAAKTDRAAGKLQREFQNELSKRTAEAVKKAQGVRVTRTRKLRGGTKQSRKYVFGDEAQNQIAIQNVLSQAGRGTRPGIRAVVLGNPLSPSRGKNIGITLPIHPGIRGLRTPGRVNKLGGGREFKWGRTLGQALDERVQRRVTSNWMNLAANQARGTDRRGQMALREAFQPLSRNPQKRDRSLERIFHYLTASSDVGASGVRTLERAIKLTPEEKLVVQNWRKVMNELARGGQSAGYLRGVVDDYVPRFWATDQSLVREIEAAVQRPGSLSSFRRGRTLPNVVNYAEPRELAQSIMRVADQPITEQQALALVSRLHHTSKHRVSLETLARRIERGNTIHVDSLTKAQLRALKYDQAQATPLFRQVESPASEGRVLLELRRDSRAFDPNVFGNTTGDLEKLFSAQGDQARLATMLQRMDDAEDPFWDELTEQIEAIDDEIELLKVSLTPEEVGLATAYHGTPMGERPWFAATGVKVDYDSVLDPLKPTEKLPTETIREFSQRSLEQRVPKDVNRPWSRTVKGRPDTFFHWVVVYQPRSMRQMDRTGRLSEFWLTREEAMKHGDDIIPYRVMRGDIDVDVEAVDPRAINKHKVLINTSKGSGRRGNLAVEQLNEEGYPMQLGFHMGTKEAAEDRVFSKSGIEGGSVIHPMFYDPNRIAGPSDLGWQSLDDGPWNEYTGMAKSRDRFPDPDDELDPHDTVYSLFKQRNANDPGALTPAEELAKRGFSGIRYQNTGEDVGSTSFQLFQREGAALDTEEFAHFRRHGRVYKNENGVLFIGPKNLRTTKGEIPEGIPPQRHPAEAGPFDDPWDAHDIGGQLGDTRTQSMPEVNLARAGATRMKAEGITQGFFGGWRTLDGTWGKSVDELEHLHGNYYRDPESGMEYIRVGDPSTQQTLVDVSRYGIGEDRAWPVTIVDDVNTHLLSHEGKTSKFVYQSGLETGLEKVLGSVRWGVTVPFPAYHIRNMISDVIKSLQADSGVLFHPIVNAKMIAGAYGLRLGSKVNVPNIGKMNMEDFLLWADMFGVRSNQHFAEFAQLVKGGELTAARLPGRAVNKLTEWGASREDVTRYATFLQALRRNGGDAAEAAMYMTRHHFDYNDLKGFERRWFRNLFLFYTWYRKNIPLQLVELARRPGFFAGVGATYRSLEAGETPINVGPLAGPTPPIQALQPYLSDKLQAAKLSWKDHAMTVGYGAPWADLQWLSAEGARDLLTVLNPAIPLGYALREQKDPLTGRPYQSYEVSGLAHALSDLGFDLPKDKDGNPTLPWWANVIGRNIPVLGRGTANLMPSAKGQDEGALNKWAGYLAPLTGLNVKVHPKPGSERAQYNIGKWVAGRAIEYKDWQSRHKNLPGKSEDTTKKPHTGRYLEALKEFNRETIQRADEANVPRKYLKEIPGLPQYLSKEERGIPRKRTRKKKGLYLGGSGSSGLKLGGGSGSGITLGG